MRVFPTRQAQRGAALIALAAIAALGITWMMISALGSASQRTAANRVHNARVLAEAKVALIGWVAANALEGTENNPGRLPCPQAWGDVGSANEGRAAPVCSVPAAGWLPWRTLGIPKPLDASGNQVWYVISPGWHLPNTSTSLTINSNTPGQLTVDGQPAVALLVAPGPSLRIAPNANQVAAGCVARAQSQAVNLPGTPPNPLDFLDCQNGSVADGIFTVSVVENSTNPVFNDQVAAVTTADVLPGLEAAIAKRIERDIAPALKNVYATSDWGLNPTNPVFPFAAPFANPGTSNFRGATNTFEGLLPFSMTQGCDPATDPRCTNTHMAWSSSGAVKVAGSGTGTIRTDVGVPNVCAWESPDVFACSGAYGTQPLSLSVTVTITNVAMGLRAQDLSKVTCIAIDDEGQGIGPQPVPCSVTSIVLQNNGSAIVTVSSNALPDVAISGWNTWALFKISFNRALIGDHALLSPADATTGWFVRNEWFRLAYYAVAPNPTAGATPRLCNNGTYPCLQVTNVTPANQSAILILAGRSFANASRPNADLIDFVEGENRPAVIPPLVPPPPRLTFEQRRVNSSFNDRVIVVDANP